MKKFWILALTMLALACTCAFAATTSKELVLPTDLTTIEAEAFYGTKALNRVVVPEGVTTIGARAFSGSGLEAILIPASVTEISDEAFEGTDAVIHCYADSPIHTYVQENEMEFVLLP